VASAVSRLRARSISSFLVEMVDDPSAGEVEKVAEERDGLRRRGLQRREVDGLHSGRNKTANEVDIIPMSTGGQY